MEVRKRALFSGYTSRVAHDLFDSIPQPFDLPLDPFECFLRLDQLPSLSSYEAGVRSDRFFDIMKAALDFFLELAPERLDQLGSQRGNFLAHLRLGLLSPGRNDKKADCSQHTGH